MNVFMTGVTGYIGSVVARHFLSQGYQVTGLVRSPEKAEQLATTGISPIIGSLVDLSILDKCTAEADGVIHMAISHTADMEQLDVSAVRTMLKRLEDSSKPFIYTSGTLIYNDTFQNVVDENTDLNPLPFLQWKADLEQEVLSAAERNIRTIVIRPTLVYGRGGGLLQGSIRLAKQLQSANYIDDGSNAWSTINVEDLADLYVCAFSKAQPGSLFNAASREMITTKELMTSIGKLVGVETRSWAYEEAVKVIGPAAWGSRINQRISGLRAEEQLHWKAQSASIIKEIEAGSYKVMQNKKA